MRKKNLRFSNRANLDYELFLKSVQPVYLGLVESSCKLDREKYARLMSQRGRAERTVSTDYNLTAAKDDHFDATGRFLLMVTERGKSNPSLTIEAIYSSHFHCEAPVNRELADRFVASELRLVMWPYYRELISDLCGKMAIPPITIPLAARGN